MSIEPMLLELVNQRARLGRTLIPTQLLRLQAALSIDAFAVTIRNGDWNWRKPAALAPFETLPILPPVNRSELVPADSIIARVWAGDRSLERGEDVGLIAPGYARAHAAVRRIFYDRIFGTVLISREQEMMLSAILDSGLIPTVMADKFDERRRAAWEPIAAELNKINRDFANRQFQLGKARGAELAASADFWNDIYDTASTLAELPGKAVDAAVQGIDAAADTAGFVARNFNLLLAGGVVVGAVALFLRIKGARNA